MGEFEYKKGVLAILSKWKYIAISILGAFLISIWVIPIFHEEKYVATVSITLSVTNYENLGDNLNQNEQLIFNYDSLIKSDALIYEIIEKNGYEYSINDVKNMIETEILENTTIINIKVENDSEVVARKILSDIIEKLKEESRNIYSVDNVYVLNDILIKNEENFNLFIMILATTALGGIFAIAVIAVLIYLNKVIAVEKGEHKILDIEIVAKFLKDKKNTNISDECNNISLFLKKKNSKIIGFLGDKYCDNKEEIILDLYKNISDKKVLLVTYNQQENSFLNNFLTENKFKKKKKRVNKKEQTGEDDTEMFTSESNNLELLNFRTRNSIVKLEYEPRSMGNFKRRFNKYDYIFIDLDNKDSVDTKVFSDLCNTFFILSKNYVSREENVKEIKEICIEKNIANFGLILV